MLWSVVPVICCCITNNPENLASSNNKHLLSHSVMALGVLQGMALPQELSLAGSKGPPDCSHLKAGLGQGGAHADPTWQLVPPKRRQQPAQESPIPCVEALSGFCCVLSDHVGGPTGRDLQEVGAFL